MFGQSLKSLPTRKLVYSKNLVLPQQMTQENPHETDLCRNIRRKCIQYHRRQPRSL